MSEAGSKEEPTPRSWRIAAGALLFGGTAAGVAIGRGRWARLVPVLTGGVAAAAAVPVALASRRPPVTPAQAATALAVSDAPPTFSILVPARDEATVLPALVADVARQDYRARDGEPLFELIVVDDRSTDGTAAAAILAAKQCGIGAVTRVVERRGRNLPDGKGAALTAAQPEICRGDVVLVLDGDARVGEHFLRRAAGYFAAGLQAATARRRTEPAVGLLAGAQADEQTLDGELQRGRWALGGCSEFRGNGIMIRRDLLQRAGGWRARALTEDLELSSRVAAAEGVRVAWVIDAEICEEPVTTWSGLLRQRLRWAEGALRRAIEHTPDVVSSPTLPVAAKADYLTYVGQLAVPAAGAGFALGALSRGRLGLIVATALGYAGAGAILGWDALRWERRPDGSALPASERAARAARVAAFNWLWLFAVPGALWNIALRRGHIRYVKMEHRGRTDAEDE